MADKTTTKPKTPANNVEDGVNNVLETIQAIQREIDRAASADMLSGPVPDGITSANWTAVLLKRTGYFGDLTVPQIAARILVGRSLGLDDMQGAFDLEIADGPSVTYRRPQSHAAAANAVAETNAANRAALERTTPESTSPPAARDNVIQLPKTGQLEDGRVINEGDEITSDGTTAGTVITPAAENAGAGSTSDDKAEKDLTPAQDAETASNAKETPSAAASGDDDPAAADENGTYWRDGIKSMLHELNVESPKIAERLRKFDDAPHNDRRKMHRDCQTYYAAKLDGVRAEVLAGLKADGKATPDAQKGFFIYADVPTDPAVWDFKQAMKAFDALGQFLSRK